jgi:hypothetical protein
MARAVALAAALATGAGGCVTKQAASDRVSTPVAVAASYGDCAAARDAPSCLLLRAVATEGVDAEVLLRAVVESGSVDVALKHRAALTATRGTLKTFIGPDGVSTAYINASSEEVFAAALALAAAAQIADDPFAHKAVKPLIAKGRRNETATLAAIIWSDVTFGVLWRARLTRPRGWPAIWRAVIAEPPKDTALLAAMSYYANLLSLKAESVALARALVARTDASEEQLSSARAIIVLAEGVDATDPPYDTAWTKGLLETCSGYGWCSDVLAEAAAAGATADLKMFGADLASRARREPIADRKTMAYGAASEAFRLAGEIPAALAVAREGLRFVPAATVVPETGRIEVASAAGNFAWDDDAIAPAIALYRAGARDEALRSGYLTGYARFRHAVVAGETPDARWVIADKSDFTMWRFISELIETPAPATATQFYDGLRCSEAALSDVIDPPKFNSNLAVLAALIGRAGSMRAHLGTAAVTLDDKAQIIPGFLAHRLAEDWRRTLVIAERSGAKSDKLIAASCVASSIQK